MSSVLPTKRILVTGATGFVGRSLCSTLVEKGFQVRTSVRSLLAGSESLPSQIELCLVKDIHASTDWKQALNQVDVVIHLAARVHIMRQQSDAEVARYQHLNVEGTLNLARQAAAAGVRRLVFLSSIKVNGEATYGSPFDAYSIPDPQDPYAISKHEAEKALLALMSETGMKITILRPPLVYGPGVKANFLGLMKVVDRGIPLPIESINNRRSLIYVENLAGALIVCAIHPKAAGQIYLVSDGEDVSTPQLIQKIAKALGCPNRVFPFPVSLLRFLAKIIGKSSMVDRLTQSLVVDSSKIREELGWKPPYTLEQGLAATADWYRASFSQEKK